MNKEFFSEDELQELGMLEVRGGDSASIMSQDKCTNNSYGCYSGADQTSCTNSAEGCGATVDRPTPPTPPSRPNHGCVVTQGNC